MPDARELERLRADARYARERRDLYRARAYSQRPVNADRLRTLEREAQAAADRLAFAIRPPDGDQDVIG